jgi:hypothetical protein
MDTIVDSLRDRKRCGDAAKKRKIGNSDAHAAFVRELLEKHDARLQLSELCTLFERQFEVRVSTSTMQRFVHRQLGFSRQRVQRQLPRQALTEKNIKWRKEFIGEWFVGADEQLIGTNDEQNDQENWQLRTDGKRDSCRRDLGAMLRELLLPLWRRSLAWRRRTQRHLVVPRCPRPRLACRRRALVWRRRTQRHLVVPRCPRPRLACRRRALVCRAALASLSSLQHLVMRMIRLPL